MPFSHITPVESTTRKEIEATLNSAEAAIIVTLQRVEYEDEDEDEQPLRVSLARRGNLAYELLLISGVLRHALAEHGIECVMELFIDSGCDAAMREHFAVILARRSPQPPQPHASLH